MSGTISQDASVDFGEVRLNLRCLGSGSPTVVFESGLGEGLDRWTRLQDEVAAFTRAVAYDRAGLGKSMPGLAPRTSQNMVKELHALLEKNHIAGPYLLVGHSFGGLNGQLFAKTYPSEVAGILLLDPSLADQLQVMKQVMGECRSGIFNWLSFSRKPEGMTLQDMQTSCEQVTSAGPLPDVPLVVISAGKTVDMPGILKSLFASEKFLKSFQEGHAALVRSVPRGRLVPAENSHHMSVPHDPAVLEIIREMVQGSPVP